MAEKPGRSDVELLLRLLELFLSEPLRKARNFWRTIPDGLTFAELTEKYPQGSEGFEHIDIPGSSSAGSPRSSRNDNAAASIFWYAYHRLVDWKARPREQPGQPAPK
jgi:hypothetical protein